MHAPALIALGQFGRLLAAGPYAAERVPVSTPTAARPPCHTARVPDVELSKVANCFIPSAATRGNTLGSARWAVGAFGKRHGGLWVGGRIHMRDGRIWFSANGVNRAFHSNVGDHGLRLADVVSVEVRPGVLTKIIDVSTKDDVLRFRCFGAPAVARTVRHAVDQAVAQPALE
jgi:hypothetical protein